MKHNCILSLLLLASLLFLCYCHTATHSTPSAPLGSSEVPADDVIPPRQTPPPKLRLHASGACLMDASSGRILYGKNETSPLPMASTTKS